VDTSEEDLRAAANPGDALAFSAAEVAEALDTLPA
jgi:hypothetical protein